jgi:MFS family permease
MTDSAYIPDDARAKRNVMILVMAQAILGAQMPMIFTIGGLAGQSLATNLCWATLPISLIVLGSMLSATPLSAIMQRYGRRTGFVIGAMAGALGGAIGAYGLYLASFPVFLLGSLITGVYMSCQGFYRFAAADTASEGFRPKAISYVMAGGLLSAVIGPQLVKVTAESMVIPFLGTYLAVIVINLIGSGLFFFLDIPTPAKPAFDAPKGRSRMELLKTPAVAVAVICATVSYALMNLVMTSSPLAVVGCGFQTNDAANVVTAHVLAMYAPSFFTGHLIARFGVERIVGLGLMILAGAGGVALMGVELEHFFVALILLGIGWNFGFIGATTMLTANHAPHERAGCRG